jgi:hypothetical protein
MQVGEDLSEAPRGCSFLAPPAQFDWTVLDHNSTDALVDICQELNIPVANPIVRQDLINKISSRFDIVSAISGPYPAIHPNVRSADHRATTPELVPDDEVLEPLRHEMATRSDEEDEGATLTDLIANWTGAFAFGPDSDDENSEEDRSDSFSGSEVTAEDDAEEELAVTMPAALKGGSGSYLLGLDLGTQQICFRLIMIVVHLLFLAAYSGLKGDSAAAGLEL